MAVAMITHCVGFSMMRVWIEDETIWGAHQKSNTHAAPTYPHYENTPDGTHSAIVAAGTLSALAVCAVLNGIINMYIDIDDLDKRTQILISISRVKDHTPGGAAPGLRCCGIESVLAGLVTAVAGGAGEDEEDEEDDDGEEEDEEDEEGEEGEEDEEEEDGGGGGGGNTGSRHINLALSSSQDKVPNVHVWGYYKNVIALQLATDVKKCECFLTPLCICAMFLAFALVIISSVVKTPEDYLSIILIGMFGIILTLECTCRCTRRA